MTAAYKALIKLVFLLSAATLLQACISFGSNETWPSNVPNQHFFIDYCIANSQSCTTDSMAENYLSWVKRFYFGSIFYPTGWLEMSDLVTASLDRNSDKQNAKVMLDSLGLTIVLEWAKDNNERLINSQNIATWGEALRTSAENDEQIEFIQTIQNDVASILSQTLKAEEISIQRYYPANDYDNF